LNNNATFPHEQFCLVIVVAKILESVWGQINIGTVCLLIFIICCSEIVSSFIQIYVLLQARQRKPKNRLPMKGTGLQRRSAFSIRLFLKEFCVEFLNGAYNTLMYHVKVSGFL